MDSRYEGRGVETDLRLPRASPAGRLIGRFDLRTAALIVAMARFQRVTRLFAHQPSSWVLVALCGVLLIFCPHSGHAGGRKVTVSRETTYLLGPLRPDGYVDYVAALNAASSQGVTPENNAAVLLWQALGPSKIPPQQRAEYFKLLGIPPLTQSGLYLTPVSKFRLKPPPANLPYGAEDPNDPDVQQEKAEQRAWTAGEFPCVANWLKANQSPLRLALEASRRPLCFSPLVGDNTNGLVAAMFDLQSESRRLAYLLATDAALNVGQGKLDEAWQDALACHRLARG